MSPFAHTIDLTMSDDESGDTSAVNTKSKKSVAAVKDEDENTPAAAAAKDESTKDENTPAADAAAAKDESDKDKDTSHKPNTRLERAKKFAALIQERRDKRKREMDNVNNVAQKTQKTKRKKTPKKTKTAELEGEGIFKVGSTISGQWKGPQCKGDWYEGVIKSINKTKKTVHVKYNDGDVDKHLPWSKMRVVKQ